MPVTVAQRSANEDTRDDVARVITSDALAAAVRTTVGGIISVGSSGHEDGCGEDGEVGS